eukprot:Lithocolla_globosa_v1_NODE_1044_length_2920_cov_5.618848.p1 type:complete len:605 gc:universal NODE_1044_length_2920_cov_5.618848:1820-6(-)
MEDCFTPDLEEQERVYGKRTSSSFKATPLNFDSLTDKSMLEGMERVLDKKILTQVTPMLNKPTRPKSMEVYEEVMRKIKEANIVKLTVHIYVSQLQYNAVNISSVMSIEQIINHVILAARITPDPSWRLFEVVLDHGLERLIEMWETLTDVIGTWEFETKNMVMLRKCTVSPFSGKFMLGETMYAHHNKPWHKKKTLLVKGSEILILKESSTLNFRRSAHPSSTKLLDVLDYNVYSLITAKKKSKIEHVFALKLSKRKTSVLKQDLDNFLIYFGVESDEMKLNWQSGFIHVKFEDWAKRNPALRHRFDFSPLTKTVPKLASQDLAAIAGKQPKNLGKATTLPKMRRVAVDDSSPGSSGQWEVSVPDAIITTTPMPPKPFITQEQPADLDETFVKKDSSSSTSSNNEFDHHNISPFSSPHSSFASSSPSCTSSHSSCSSFASVDLDQTLSLPTRAQSTIVDLDATLSMPQPSQTQVAQNTTTTEGGFTNNMSNTNSTLPISALDLTIQSAQTLNNNNNNNIDNNSMTHNNNNNIDNNDISHMSHIPVKSGITNSWASDMTVVVPPKNLSGVNFAQVAPPPPLVLDTQGLPDSLPPLPRAFNNTFK